MKRLQLLIYIEGIRMDAIDPRWGAVFSKLRDATPVQGHSGTISIFTGVLSEIAYASINGANPFNISAVANVTAGIPDGYIVAFSSHIDHRTLGEISIGDNGEYYDIDNTRVRGRFRTINMNDLYKDGSNSASIPGLGLRIGRTMDAASSGSSDSMSLGTSASVLDDNMVGSILIPVIDRDGDETYYVNSLGVTYPIVSKQSSAVNLAPGLYTHDGVSDPIRIGDISEFIYVDESSLKNRIVLFTSIREAERHSDPARFYDSLASTAKADAAEKDKELVLLKSDTAKIDNDIKVDTLKAKGAYEVGSLGRKSETEEISHGRGMTLGLLALGTAGLGVITKLGLGMAFMGAISSPTGALSNISLATLFGGVGVLATISGLFSSVFTPVASLASGIISLGGSLIGGLCSVAGSLFSGGCRLLGLW